MMKKPTTRHDFTPDKFPLTIRIYSGKTEQVLWSRTVTLDDARSLARLEIPSYSNTEHWPVRAEMVYADGTVKSEDVGLMVAKPKEGTN